MIRVDTKQTSLKMTNRFRGLRTVLAMMTGLVIAVALSLAGLCLVRHYAPAEVLRASNAVVGTYLQTMGTVYAVLLGFVVYVVWSEFNEARLQCEREANEIADFYRVAGGFPEAAREVLQGHLRRYTDEVMAHEWAAMARGDEETIDRVGRILDETWNGLESLKPESVSEGTLHHDALSRFNELSSVRTTRLVCMRLRIPFTMQLVLYTGAVMVLGSMWLFYLDSFALHAIISGCAALTLSSLLYLVWDLDNCFAGNWRVSRAPFRRARRYMMDESALR